MQFPSIWGRHDQAKIDPVFVRGMLVSTISQAPDEWDERLAGLGFRRTQYGWARVGGITQSEYAYLSPEIDLVGFRVSDVIEVPAEVNQSGLVPYEIQDGVLRLWQRRYQALESAMAFEHGEVKRRGALWTHVEDALAGTITPESETVLSLAIEVIRPEGLSPEVEEFDDRLRSWRGGDGLPTQTLTRGPLLIKQGATVEWADQDGQIVQGRLARPLHAGDSAFLALREAPAWVGGYPLVAPIRVPRSALFFRGEPADYAELPEDESNAPALAMSPANDVGLLDMPLPQISPEILRYLESRFVTGAFVSTRDPDSREMLKVSLDGRFDAEDVESALQWVDAVMVRLNALGRTTFPDDPFDVELTAAYDEELAVRLAASVAVVSNGDVFRSQQPPVAVLQKAGDDFDWAACQSELRTEVERRYKMLEASSAVLGAQSEGGGRKLPFRAVTSTEDLIRSLGASTRSSLDEEGLLRALAVVLRSEHLFDFMDRTSVDEALGFARRTEGGPLNFDVVRVKGALLHLGEVTALARSSQGGMAIRDLAQEMMESYAVVMQTTDQSLYDSPPAGITATQGSMRRGIAWERAQLHRSLDAALHVYDAALGQISERLIAPDRIAAEEHCSTLRAYHLWAEMKAIPSKLKAMGDERLMELAEADFLRLGGTRVASIGEVYRKRLLSRVVQLAQKDGIWGVALEVKQRHAYFHPIAMKGELLGETRTAVMSAAVADIKGRGGRATVIPFDTLAWCSPELVSRLNGAAAPAAADRANEPNQRSEGNGAYVDTGVVAGWAPKDLRSLNRDELVMAAERMTDDQKNSYLTKEVLWPRRSFDELKEQGVDVKVAVLHDMVWRTIDSAPKSLLRNDIGLYIRLVRGFKELDDCLDKPLHLYVDRLNAVINGLFSGPENLPLRQRYRARDLRIRGFQTTLDQPVSLIYSPGLQRKIEESSWENLIKARKPSASAGKGSRVLQDAVTRTGPDYRNGRSVTGEDFIRTFGFSGVEYGNWTNQREREKHLNFAYDSMMDFAKTMGWEPMALSLGGKLGLCIGSRGRGGPRAANAHFEPVNMAINLTRMRGDGALAHEFFHAVATHFGRQLTGQPLDLANSIAFPLRDKHARAPGEPRHRGEIRQEVLSSFHALMTSIMRAPEVEGAAIQDYTKPSRMLLKALEEDGRKTPYWSQPAEMFARAAEVWFAKVQQDAGQKNDYLVRRGKLDDASGLYPDREHLARIDPYFKEWVSAVKTSVQNVIHPFLGSVDMPVLNSYALSKQPLAPMDLAILAEEQLKQLFRSFAPDLTVHSSPEKRAGLYHLAKHLIVLNACHADEETFAHEAWHAANAVLLTDHERAGLNEVFAPDGPMAKKVIDALRQEGHFLAIHQVLDDPKEIQAYAYQLWSVGKLTLERSQDEFERCKGFVDGVIEVGQTFGEGAVLEVFERFKSGQLAERAEKLKRGQDMDWDEENIIWNVDVPTEKASSVSRLRFG